MATSLSIPAMVVLPDGFTQAELTAVYTAFSIPADAVIQRNVNLQAVVIAWNATVTY